MKIEGLPEGYDIVRIGRPVDGELVLGWQKTVFVWDGHKSDVANHIIVRKIERPKQYRPFANAEEFKPHREKWWKWIEDTSGVFPPASYNEFSHEDETWIDSFNFKVFEDGSPFGVEVSE